MAVFLPAFMHLSRNSCSSLRQTFISTRRMPQTFIPLLKYLRWVTNEQYKRTQFKLQDRQDSGENYQFYIIMFLSFSLYIMRLAYIWMRRELQDKSETVYMTIKHQIRGNKNALHNIIVMVCKKRFLNDYFEEVIYKLFSHLSL